MIKVAITGNIASGKSCVENYLNDKGFKVIDADKVNHSLLLHDDEVIKEIKNLFKNQDIIGIDGTLSREKIGKIVFSDKKMKSELEKILHKKIDEEIEQFIKINEKEKIIFVSVPLLFETNQDVKYDIIIFVSAKKKIRLIRLMKRNNFSEEYAKVRINSQMKEELKIKKSDYVIYNNSDFENIKHQIDNILKELI